MTKKSRQFDPDKERAIAMAEYAGDIASGYMRDTWSRNAVEWSYHWAFDAAHYARQAFPSLRVEE